MSEPRESYMLLASVLSAIDAEDDDPMERLRVLRPHIVKYLTEYLRVREEPR